MITMYRIFNDKNASLAELVTKDARELAQHVAAGDETTKSQIRRFYQEYVMLRRSIPPGDKDAYKKHEVALKMLIAKVEYAAARKGSKINEKFKKWLKENLQALNGPEDVHNFGDYFEAFVGYFWGAQPDKDKKDQQNR